MANNEQLKLLKEGVEAWNSWRDDHPDDRVDLSGSRLDDIDLEQIDLHGAVMDRIRLRWGYLRRANLENASLISADLRIVDLSKARCSGAIFRKASLQGAYLRQTNFTSADLSHCNLKGVNLDRAILKEANLEGSDLSKAVIVDADLTDAVLDGCRVYGTSVWNIRDESTKQENLIITRPDEPSVTVDNLEVAQFIYLMLNNRRVRNVIDTITSKAVLVLGSFRSDRKKILDALREELRKRNYLPIIFDFDVPSNRDTDETVNLLARMARFIVADLTEAKSVLQELKGIVESLPSVPVQPIVASFDQPHGMFDHMRRYPWMLAPIWYEQDNVMAADLSNRIIDNAEMKLAEIRRFSST